MNISLFSLYDVFIQQEVIVLYSHEILFHIKDGGLIHLLNLDASINFNLDILKSFTYVKNGQKMMY